MGQAVPHAATWRNGRLLTPPPARPQQAERLPGRWLWGGVLWRYFPHFVTESVTRLWALEHIDQAGFDGILFTPKNPGVTDPPPGFQREFLTLMGCDLPIREARVPCVPDELFVPGQGFGLGEISRGTDRFIETMALRFAQDVAPDGPSRLYISRSRLGAGRGMNRGRGPRSRSSEGDIMIWARSTPDEPSIMQWWIFVMTAKRSFSRPSTTQISQSGRALSRGWAMMREDSFFSWLSVPGWGSAVWRTW